MHKSYPVLAALAVLLLVVACHPPAKQPSVTIATAPDSLLRGDSTLLVASVDPKSAVLNWSAVKNTVTALHDTEAWYRATQVGYDTVTVIATNDDLADTAIKAIKVYATVYGSAEYDNTDAIEVPFPVGDTYSPIVLGPGTEADDSVPEGAIVDSVQIYHLSFDYPSVDSFPDLNIWLEEPGGTRVQIWDVSRTGDPEGTYPPSNFAAFVGKPAVGTWKLVVHAENSVVPGAIDDFWLQLWYHKRLP